MATFNYSTILSSFDKRGTLMKQLQDMENAFEGAGLTDVEVVDATDTSLKLKFDFADGTSLTTSAIDIKGAKGDTGNPATVAVGTVSTLPEGYNATVTNTGTASNAVFDFGIPKGDTGEAGGITDINGYTGAVTTGNGLSFNSGALSSYDFNLTNAGTVAMNTLTKPTGISSMSGTFRYALNSDKSIGKLYGYLSFTAGTISSNTPCDIDTGVIVSVPASEYTIVTGQLGIAGDGSGTGFGCQFTIKTNGHVHIAFTLTASQSNKQYWVMLPACIYFFKDFGDTPDNRSFAMRMNAINNDPTIENER